MADKGKRPARAGRDAMPEKGSGQRRATAAIGIIVIVDVVAGALAYGLYSNPPTSFANFRNRFNSAPRVAIFTTGYNGTQVSSTVGCASAVIEEIVGSATSHRNASSIDFFAINQTACVYENGIGGLVKNYTYNSIANCINTSRGEPSIFINYSDSGNSTVIKPSALYITGDQKFLAMCGIASEIS